MLCSLSPLWNILGVVIALLAVAYAYFKWTYQYWARKNVPIITEPKIPFGNLGNLFTEPRGENIAKTYKAAKDKGWRYCGLYTLVSPNLLVIDLDLVKNILTKDFQYFTDRGAYTNEKVDPVGKFSKWMKEQKVSDTYEGGLAYLQIMSEQYKASTMWAIHSQLQSCHLFAISGPRWRHLRTKLTPTFTSGKLKYMFPTLVDCGLVLENYIEENIKPDEAVDIKETLACFSTDVIGSCAFGLDCNSFKEPDSAFRRFGNKVFNISKMVALRVLFCSNFPTLARMLGLRQLPKDTADFFTKVVQDTVSYREKNNVVRKDFLQLLMEIRDPWEGQQDGHSGDDGSLTMNEIIAQSFVFFVAGFETSSTTMTFALFELATRPEIQDRVRDEINEVLARHDGKMTYDSLSEMKYMTQVVDETLRVHSPARLLRRVCVNDYKVPGEDLVIEKGTSVVISVRGIHYDEEYWENPTEFDPERFTEEKKKNMNQYTHLPFGQGPRICIGERFGLMQVKVGLTCLLRKFRVKLDKKTRLPLKMAVTSLVNSAEGGIWLNLEKI